jgi:hypothetical protein
MVAFERKANGSQKIIGTDKYQRRNSKITISPV